MKISNGQLILLLLLFRVFTLMTYIPLMSDGYEPSVMILGIALSSVVQALLVIVVVIFGKRFGEYTTGSLAVKFSVPLGRIICIAYLIYFIFSGGAALADFQRFMSAVFIPMGNEIVSIIIIAAVCIYGASTGIMSVSRTGAAVFVVFAAMFAAMLIFSIGKADMSLYEGGFGVNPSSVATAFLDDFSRSGELVLLTFLMPYIKNIRTAVYGFIAAKTAVLCAAVLMIITVLGGYVKLTDFPLFTLGSALGSTARLDAVYIVVWSLTAVVKISLVTAVCGELFGTIMPEMKSKSFISGGLICISAVPMILAGAAPSPHIFSGSAVILILGFAIPAAIMIIGGKTNEKANGGNIVNDASDGM